MLQFNPPRHDPSTFANADFDPVVGLVQSLRWYNSRASLLLYFSGMHETIETEAKNPASARPLTSDAFYMLRRSIVNSVIVEARALHDRDARSLGGCQIAKRLGDPVAREGLHKFLTEYPHGRVMKDVAQRNRYLDYVQRYCSLMAPPKGVTIPAHPLAGKVELVRRMANKAVAHSTLDDYTLGGEDLSHVVIASVVVACAIDAVMGDAATSDDFAVIESSGYRAAGHLLHVEVDDSPYNVNMIRGFLPAWVKFGQEFPNHPGGFRRVEPLTK